MSGDRSWMHRRIPERGTGVSSEFKKGVKEFLEFAYAHATDIDDMKIRCPCKQCDLLEYHTEDDVAVHLYRRGFIENYTKWYAHGEPFHIGESSRSANVDVDTTTQEPNTYRNMVLDAAGPDFDWDNDPNVDAESFGPATEELPNPDAAQFYKLLQDAEEPLYEGCQYSRLSVVSQFLNLKSDFNIPENCYDRMMAIVKRILPKGEKLPSDFYGSKKMVRKLGLGYKMIHACPNHCMLYYREHESLTECVVCRHPRYKTSHGLSNTKKYVPFKVLRYLPVTPRLQRLFMSTRTAKDMTWHHKHSSSDGVLVHPSDGEAWKQFDRIHPSFAGEPRNVRLGLSTDGFNPFGHSATPYSCWPVFLTPYNLPPWMCMKQPYLFLTLIIPGPSNPGKNLDVYLRPLIEELKGLWDVGVNTYDVSHKQNFQMKASLMWTISDFPAYGMLSG